MDLSGWATAKENEGHWQDRNWGFSYDGKSTADDPSIETEESFGDFGFIFDVRLHEASNTARVLLRGSDKAAITIDTDDPFLAKHLAKPRKWNRFEGIQCGDQLTLILNGHELFKGRSIAGLPDGGPIRIVPSGPIDFANVYVRELGKARKEPQRLQKE